jgi:hypothetical protein
MRPKSNSAVLLLSAAVFAGSLVATASVSAREIGAEAQGPLADLKQNIDIPVGGPKKLGDLNQDLVYTPVQPCRIVDTRNTAAGVIAAGTTRSFVAINAASFTSQGGSATNCGTLGVAATAVAVNFTVVNTLGAAFITVFPFGTTQPLAATMTYGLNDLISNTAIVKIPNPLASSDFSVFAAAGTHLVADIVGYFAPPLATALDCATVSGVATNVPAGAYSSLPTLFCAANYTPVALSISAAENVLVADSYTAGNAGQIFVRSLSANAQNVTAKLMCCRVPGR